MTIAELLAQLGNTTYVSFRAPDEDEKFRMEVAIDVGKEQGSPVFGVEFEELTPGDASATFQIRSHLHLRQPPRADLDGRLNHPPGQ
jgi:hypothetical protein